MLFVKFDDCYFLSRFSLSLCALCSLRPLALKSFDLVLRPVKNFNFSRAISLFMLLFFEK